jgi:uncharacterized glyoxalase superfamily protein PhnB
MSTAPPRRPSFIPSPAYKDNRVAIKWLQDAFGVEPSEVLTDAEGNIVHAEMTHGDGVVMIGTEWADWTRSPALLGVKNTQRVHTRIESGIDEHWARSRRAGAKIVKEPEDQFYGDLAVRPGNSLGNGNRRRSCRRSRSPRAACSKSRRSGRRPSH